MATARKDSEQKERQPPAPYTLAVSNTAKKGMRKLPDGVKEQMRNAIAALIADPYPKGSEKMKGVFKDCRRMVVANDYRVVYAVDTQKRHINVEFAADRKQVYRRR